MKKLLLPALIILFITAQAQEKNRYPVQYNKAISLNPLMLIGPDFTFTMGYEYRLKPNLVIAPEAGVILGSAYFSNGSNSKGAWGVLLRPSVKFFVNTDQTFYMQPQLFYKLVNHSLHDWIGKDCVDGVPAYEKLQDFKYLRQAYGFNIIAGRLIPTKKGKLLFDFYLGLGIRHKTEKVAGEPNSCYNPVGIGFGSFEQMGTMPNVPAGVRLLIAL